MIPALAAIRPVVTSQLLGAWLHGREQSFTADEACVPCAGYSTLPPQLFVDPELRANPDRLVRAAIPLMVEWQILERDGEGYRLAPERLHPQFPFVRDIIAYQAAFLEETVENARYGERPA